METFFRKIDFVLHKLYANFGVSWPLRNFSSVQIRHWKYEVEIIPVQEAVLDGEFAEAFPVVIRLHRRMPRLVQVLREVHEAFVAVVETQTQLVGRHIFR